MPMDRFLIAPMSEGIRTDLRPWQIPDESFENMLNAYVFRGRIRKRFGSYLTGDGASSPLTAPLLSRLRVNIGTTDGAGNIAVIVPGAKFGIGQAFSISNEIFTVVVLGTPGNMLTTGASTVHTYDTTTGAVVINGAAPNTAVFFYTGEPVMGLTTYAQSGVAINNQPTFAFDTQFAYIYTVGIQSGWSRSQTGGQPVFTGTDINFFWVCNWYGLTPDAKAMFVTNFNAPIPGPGGDVMWSYTGAWAPFSPLTIFDTAGSFVQTALIIVPFHNRLVLLNTIENIKPGNTNKAFVNRCRYSFNGSPFAANAWLEPNQTNGTALAAGAGFIDAATDEQIVSAEFIKDRLIVFFERSTYELAWTGNEVLPFVWQQLNTELGSESLKSSVPFDKAVLTMASVGVHACNGSNVERIDQKIPEKIFEIQNKNNGIRRVAGIRHYFPEMVYWAFPSSDENPVDVFPNRVLVYNYKADTWAFNDDCITAFGYFNQAQALTWATTAFTWEQAVFTWNSGAIQDRFRNVIAGNQQGYVFIISVDVTRNAPVMQITNMVNTGDNLTVTIINHTLTVGENIAIENAQGATNLNEQIFEVIRIIDRNTILLGRANIIGIYTGGGTATRISIIEILSKEWNPYIDQGKNFYLAKIDFGVEKTSLGEVYVDYFPSSSELSMVNEAMLTNSIMGDGTLSTAPYDLYALEQHQRTLWHPVYFQSYGEFIQINITYSQEQSFIPDIVWSDFQLEGLVLFTQLSGSRLE